MDRLLAAYASSPLLFWLLVSVLVYALGTNLSWLIQSKSSLNSLLDRWVTQVGRFLFYLGIPYLVLGGWPRQPFQGLLSLEELGLVGLSLRWPVTRWLGAAGTALAVGLASLVILALAWVNANRSARDARLYFPTWPWWTIPVEGLYLQVHWTFYRTALAVLLNDVYAGVFAGVGLVLIEWSLNPAWRRGWRPTWRRQNSQAASQWLHAALALVAALVFLLTRNLWLCLAIHWLLEVSLRLIYREQANPQSGA